MSILVPDDFKFGRYAIPLNQEQEDENLPSYIDRVEAKFLPRLFGKELYDLFILDLADPVIGEPTDPRFVFIYNPFTFQEDYVRLLESGGIEDMLKGLVYYEYVRDNITRLSTTGAERTKSENSVSISGIQHDLNGRYNEAIRTYQDIQEYMCVVDPGLYPEYKGIHERKNHTF